MLWHFNPFKYNFDYFFYLFFCTPPKFIPFFTSILNIIAINIKQFCIFNNLNDIDLLKLSFFLLILHLSLYNLINIPPKSF